MYANVRIHNIITNYQCNCFLTAGGPVIADVQKDVTQLVDSNEKSQTRQYYSGTVSHPFTLKPVYEYDTKFRGDFTSLTRGHRHTVDHIFYSVLRNRNMSPDDRSAVLEGRLHLIRRLKVPTTDVFKNGSLSSPQPSLPTETVPSDHVPLLADFRLDLPRMQASNDIPLASL